MSAERAERLWEIVIQSVWPLLEGTLKFTFPLSIISFILGLTVAMGIALAGLSSQKWLRYPSRVYVWIVRGTPILLQLFLLFYGLPNFGIVLPAFLTVIIAFTIAEGAYCAEIIRSAIKSVPAGQWRAGSALGMNRLQIFIRIILPQAARVSIPPLCNQFISLFKSSSIAALVTIQDLFGVAKQIAATTFEPMLLFAMAGFYYLVISSLLTVGQHYLERQFGKYTI